MARQGQPVAPLPPGLAPGHAGVWWHTRPGQTCQSGERLPLYPQSQILSHTAAVSDTPPHRHTCHLWKPVHQTCTHCPQAACGPARPTGRPPGPALLWQRAPRHGAGTLHIVVSWRSWALTSHGGSRRPLALRCQGWGSTSVQAWGACSVGSHCRPAAWVSSKGTTGCGCFFPYAFGGGKARSERQESNTETKLGEFMGHPGPCRDLATVCRVGAPLPEARGPAQGDPAGHTQPRPRNPLHPGSKPLTKGAHETPAATHTGPHAV